MSEPEPNTLTSELIVTGLKFLNAGINICATAADGSKAPIGSWKQYQDRMIDPLEFMQQLQHSDGFGVICGTISGNLEMVELEGRAIHDNLHQKAHEIAHGTGLGELWDYFNTTYMEMTPSGGIHWLYRITDHKVPGNTKLARRPGENGGVEVLAETRGEAGFCIVAPSGGTTHPTGDPWIALDDKTPEHIISITMEERNQIHIILKSLDQMPEPETIKAQIRQKPEDGNLSPGDDYNQRATWDEILTPQGWKKLNTINGQTFWRRPGKTLGNSATTGQTEADNLYVFTTSTVFPDLTPISKFAAYTLLTFGDMTQASFSSAARKLRSEGYGSIHPVADPKPLQPLSIDQPEIKYDPETGEILEPEESTWKPANIADILHGKTIATLPSIMKREDNQFLLYAGKVHSFYGESESGKSWIAQIAVAREMQLGKPCIYIDFESDAQDVLERFKTLGVDIETIIGHLTYIKPETRPRADDPFWQELLNRNDATLIVIDGVTEALTLWGAETKDNDSITAWNRQFPRKLAQATQAAIITIDHVTKNADTRGRFAIGGQAKLATIDGAAYLIEPDNPISPDNIGTLIMRVTKDRPGQIRKLSVNYRKSDRTAEIAKIQIDSTGKTTKVDIFAPIDRREKADQDITKIEKMILDDLDINGETSQDKLCKRIRDQITEHNNHNSNKIDFKPGKEFVHTKDILIDLVKRNEIRSIEKPQTDGRKHTYYVLQTDPE